MESLKQAIETEVNKLRLETGMLSEYGKGYKNALEWALKQYLHHVDTKVAVKEKQTHIKQNKSYT